MCAGEVSGVVRVCRRRGGVCARAEGRVSCVELWVWLLFHFRLGGVCEAPLV